MSAVPEITIERHCGEFCLFATSHAHTAIVGPRILRGSGILDIKVRHATREQAEIAAEKLRVYLAALGKGPTKKDSRGEQMEPVRKRGFWED